MTAAHWIPRFKAAGIHLIGSLLVAALAAGLVFGVWYPYPYRELAGGRELFLLVVAVDVVLGPLLTLVAFNVTKTKAHLMRDLAVIVLLQLAALGYGLWTVFVARPVYLAFEADRYRVVTAVSIEPEELAAAAAPYDRLALWGISTVGTRKPKDGAEMLESVDLALQGRDVGMRPKFYQDYALSKTEVLQKGKPVQWLQDRYLGQEQHLVTLRTSVAQTGNAAAQLLVLPVLGRTTDWVALVDKDSAQIKGFAPLSAF